MISENISLKALNTFGLEAKARFFVEFTNQEELKEAIKWSDKNDVSVIVLGGGSNVLITNDLNALILKNSLSGIEVVNEDEKSVYVKVQGGEVWHDFVMYCIDQGWGGIENMSLIPGSVGAAPMQNIGAYGVEIKDVFESLEALNRETLSVEQFSFDACCFGYRESVFKRELKGKYVIISVTLRLSKNPKVNVSYGAIKEVLEKQGIETPQIRDVSKAVIEIRNSKLPNPKKIGNSGSFFKNPVIPASQFNKLKAGYPEIPFYELPENEVKVPAGWLIEQAGWKGMRRGEVGVHDRQALVLVNHGNGNGEDIKKLSEDICVSVKGKFGISLETEVNIY